MTMKSQEKELLKKIARESIQEIILGKKMEQQDIPETLKEKWGVFVTLKKNNNLRGCIGYLRGIMPLYQAVKNMAVQSAFHDPRFEPLREEELDDIDIEISVLTPMKRIKNIEEIKVGEHGLFIENGIQSGLLLPQVATEYEWDRETFLEYTCMKAGLPRDAWTWKDTNIYIFSAEIF